MRDYEFRKKLISVLTAFLMLAGFVTGSVPIYAAQNTVSSESYVVNDAAGQTSQNTAVSTDETAEENSGKSSETDAEAESPAGTGEGSVSSDSAEGSGNDTVSGDDVRNDTVSEDSTADDEDNVSTNEIRDYVNNSVSGDNTDFYIPIGALDDETIIESPEPLPEFITDVTEQNKPGKRRKSKKSDEEAAGASKFASDYSSLDMGYLPDNGPINQGSSSLCWAFTSTMLAEISMIKKGLADKLSVRYSPEQVGYFFYNRINDPLGNTPDDKNILLLSDYWNKGGNNSFNTWSLSSWISMRDESDVPFVNRKYETLSDDKAYSSSAHLQNAYWTEIYSADPQNIDYIENVKELVYNCGGASVIISDGLSINGNHAVYNKSGGGGHNVTIVGWDDSFPKENFSTVPPGDGAWYIRDSYDGVGNRDSNGCFWMSYYSRDLTDSTTDKAIAYDFEAGDNYDNNYQYDGSAGNYCLSSGKETIRMSNVFRAKGDEILKAVAFAPASTSMSYEIKIYNLSENFITPAPEGETPLATVSGDTRYVGYRTVKLDEPVNLMKNDLFSVVVDARDTSGDNNAKLYVEGAGTNSNWLKFEAGLNPGQSYYNNTDMTSWADNKYCARIKAFTNDAGYEISDISDVTYDGTQHSPEVTVIGKNGEILEKDVDYTVSYSNNINAGTATATVYGKGYYCGSKSKSFNILPKSISGVSITGIESSYLYTGSNIKPEPVVTDPAIGGKNLVKGADYTVEYMNNNEVGEACVTIKGIGNYTGRKDTSFIISANETCYEISDISDMTYDGTPFSPEVTVIRKDGKKLEKDVDYTVSYSNNINTGTATATVYGKGYYFGSKSKSFNILPKNITAAAVAGVEASYEYTGVDIKPEPVVTDPAIGGKKLVKGADYTVEYRNNKEEGNACVTIKGIGNYTGQRDTSFFISKAEPLQLTVDDIPDQTYIPGGELIKPALKVTHGSVVLNNGSDYSAAYINNSDAGTAEVYITGVSKTIYDNSSASKSFTIKPFNLKNATVGGISDQFFVEGKTYEVSPYVTVKTAATGRTVTLKEDEDFTVTYENNAAYKSGQKVTVIINGINNYTGSIKKTFTLRSYIPISDTESFDIRLSQYEYDYDGTVKKPQVKVDYRAKGITLTEGIDYKVSYASNKNAGTAKVTVKPTKSFTKAENVKGSAIILFTIRGKTPTNLTFANISDKTYTGKQIKPKVTVYENGKKLSTSCYYVEYTGNVNAGKGRFTVYGKKNYSGELGSGTFVIKKCRFNKVKTSYKKSTDTLTVKYGNAVLRENIDYKRDASTRIITSLETNFEAGTKKY